jgi:hypothetical protein
MDISASNEFRVLTTRTDDISHRAHRSHQETLTTDLLSVADDRLEQVVEPI